LCSENGLAFAPSVVHVDFEETVMKLIENMFPSAVLKCCRFHLGQSWWRKIQSLGLSNDYKDRESDIGKWLMMIFELPFIPHEEIEDTFVEAVMSEAPVDARCTKFADYLTDKYVTQGSRFPTSLWVEPPSDARRTTNGPVISLSLQCAIYSSHPSIFVFLDAILQIQTVNYIKIRHISDVAPQSRTEKEKLDFLFNLWRKYQS
jgi:hypothetical protein